MKYATKTLALTALLLSSAAIGAETFKIDPVHTNIDFSTKHMMVSTVRGDFKEFEGAIQFDEKDIKNSSVEVKIKTASINTNNERRDNHLRSADFFDAEKHPEITFKSEKILHKGDGYLAVGPLTMRGVTKQVELPFTLTGPVTMGDRKIVGIEASLTLNRQDYGVTWNKSLDGGGVVVSDEVKINLNVEAIAKAAEKTAESK